MSSDRPLRAEEASKDDAIARQQVVEPRMTRNVTAAIFLGQGLLLLYIVSGGWLYQDDIRALIYMSGQPFWDSLLWTNGTHVVPGTHAVLWIHGTLFGLAYWPAAVMIVALKMIAVWSVWRMLREVLGRTPPAVIALAFYAFSPLALTATAWYAQALTIVPIHIALAWSLVWMTRYSKGRRPLDAALCAFCVAGGLMFAEKAIVLLAFLPAVYLFVLENVRSARDVFRVVLNSSLLWALLAIVGATWVVVYTTNDGMDGEPLALSKLGYIAVHHVSFGLVPAFVGGPWIWWRTGGKFYDDSPYFAVADPPWIVVGLLATVGSVIIMSCHRHTSNFTVRRQALNASVVLAAYYVPCFLLVALARGYMLWEQLGVDLRFWADAVPAIALALGLILKGSRVLEATRGRPAAVIGGLWLVGTLVSTVGFTTSWHRNELGPFISRASAEVAGLDEDSGFYETELPRQLISHQFGAENGTAFLISWLNPTVSVGDQRRHMKILDESGIVQNAEWLQRALRMYSPCQPLSSGDSLTTTWTAMVKPTKNLSVRVHGETSGGMAIALDVQLDGVWWPLVRQQGIVQTSAFAFARGPSWIAVKLPPNVSSDAVRVTVINGRGCISAVELGVPT